MTYKLSAKRILQIDPDTHEVVKTWNSVTEAANAFGVKRDDISQLCKRTDYYLCDENYKPKLVGGFEWEWSVPVIKTHTEKRYRVDNEDGTIGNMVYKRLDLAERECRLKNRYRAGWLVTSWDVEVAVKVG